MKKLIYISLLWTVTSAWAVTADYRFPEMEFKNVQDYISRRCTHQNGQKLQDIDFDICKEALEAAQSLASYFATKAGADMACIEAYSLGVRPMFEAWKTPTQDMDNQAFQKYQNVPFTSAETTGREKAQAQAQTQAQDDVLKIFSDAVGKRDENGNFVIQLEPNPKMEPWTGVTRAHEKHLPILHYQDLLSARLISVTDPWEKKIQASTLFDFQNPKPCNRSNELSKDKLLPSISAYFDQRQLITDADFQQGQQVLDVFLYDAKSKGRAFYDNIKNLTKKVLVEVPVVIENRDTTKSNNADLTRDTSDDPKLIDPYKTKIETKKIPLTTQEVVQYQRLFRDFFIHAYNHRYSIEYAQASFDSAIEGHFINAQALGKDIGLRYATTTADALSFSHRYQTVSQISYQNQFLPTYNETFMKISDKFKNSAVLEISNLTIIGEDEDGIFRKGEKIRASFDISNLGMQYVNATVEIAPLTNSLNQSLGSIDFDLVEMPGLSKRKFTSDILATVIANTGTSFSIPIRVTGGETLTQYKIKSTDARSIEVLALVKLDRVFPQLLMFNDNNPHESTIEFTAFVSNPSSTNKNVPFFINADIVGFTNTVSEIGEDGLGVYSLSMEDEIASNRNEPILLRTRHLDTLEVILKKKIEASIQVCANAQQIECDKQVSVSYTVEQDAKKLILEYFDKASQYSPLLQTQVEPFEQLNKIHQHEKRMNELIKYIDGFVTQEGVTRTKWKKQSQVQLTTIGVLQNMFRFHKQQNNPYYDQLGKVLSHHASTLAAPWGGGQRKHYLEALSQFSSSVSTKTKDYK